MIFQIDLPCHFFGYFPQLSDSDLLNLHKLVSSMEVKDAIFSMGAFKASGPDGLHALFY